MRFDFGQSNNHKIGINTVNITFCQLAVHGMGQKIWPNPNMATLPVSLQDFLWVHFACIKVFLPNQMMGQHLPKGWMPCK
jgi:hypothetical protein